MQGGAEGAPPKPYNDLQRASGGCHEGMISTGVTTDCSVFSGLHFEMNKDF